jgi:hypothetical protein
VYELDYEFAFLRRPICGPERLGWHFGVGIGSDRFATQVDVGKASFNGRLNWGITAGFGAMIRWVRARARARKPCKISPSASVAYCSHLTPAVRQDFGIRASQASSRKRLKIEEAQ